MSSTVEFPALHHDEVVWVASSREHYPEANEVACNAELQASLQASLHKEVECMAFSSELYGGHFSPVPSPLWQLSRSRFQALFQSKSMFISQTESLAMPLLQAPSRTLIQVESHALLRLLNPEKDVG
ncbi:hypothetical protein KOW79_004697 [Hemibagrus wyckioides]|uniref:Uncharacterized protein n=1 Tax=Hemibagrus wyckioides TaxID=337641 RepID=A0A9D3NXB5_9TELE|nr:hypothetical protein KOW79_004697 [Hemibagrus wyckioides]